MLDSVRMLLHLIRRMSNDREQLHRGKYGAPVTDAIYDIFYEFDQIHPSLRNGTYWPEP
jgi:hypothetical protein